MIRRNKGGRLTRQGRYEEDVNPMEGTSNMADAMLVLAVGIMLALIMNWNVDLTKFVDLDEIDAQDLAEEEINEVEADQALQEKGTVYQDPETGRFYIKVEE
ncbi:MAG: DUF2149 domain-containing protein [Clostridiales bacterium]|nr:DUF2149 domain-containing protein [Clostridiales bacterium]